MKHEKYYLPANGARMRTDICGICYTGGFVRPDGTCEQLKRCINADERMEARDERTAG